MLKIMINSYVVGPYSFGDTITGYIYNEDETAFNSTGYTAIVKVTDKFGNQICQDIVPTKVTDNPAVWSFSFTNTNRPTLTKINNDFAFVSIEFSKSGVQLNTRPTRITVLNTVGTL
jgi:hypothetical protein